VDGMKGVTSILADLPLPETLSRADGPRWGNPHVRASVAAGEKQTVGWAYQRPGGGRGFGFTGGHYHKSWQNDEFRKVVLNAILWTAQVEVPKKGLESKRPTEEEMLQNLDLKEKKK
jgi:trehalose utilization protein